MSSYHNLVFERDAAVGDADLLQQGMELVLKYGKYQGKALKELVVTSEGRSYLQWMIRPEASFKDTMKEKIRCVLAFAEQQMKKS